MRRCILLLADVAVLLAYAPPVAAQLHGRFAVDIRRAALTEAKWLTQERASLPEPCAKEDRLIHPFLDRPEVLQVLFHPRCEYNLLAQLPGVYPVSVEVEPGVALGARLYAASAGSAAFLYFHGNGEIAADYDELASLYTDCGVTLLVADYRGYGTSGGTPTVSSLLADAVVLFDRLDSILGQYGLMPSRRYVMGRSLGSAAAIEVALHAGKRLAGLIVESGFADTFALLRRLGLRVQGAVEERDGVGNAAKLSHVTTPTLIIHGEDDVLIPVTEGQELHRRSGAAHKRLLLIPGAGHNDLMFVGMSAYFDAIRAFVHDTAGSS